MRLKSRGRDEMKTRWTSQRIARLGFLVGQGFPAKQIAADPVIAAEPASVQRQATRYGLALRDVLPPPAAAQRCLSGLPAAAAKCYEGAAKKRGLTRDALIRLLVMTAATEPNLLDNILDDGA